MKQTDWKIIYSSYRGVAKRAIQLLSREVGRYVIREQGVYRIHVLPCEQEGVEVSKNAFLIGCYGESELIRSHVAADEVPEGGFLVKVIANPADEEGRLVVLTAKEEKGLLYAVISFLDDYLPDHAPFHGSNRMPELGFDKPLPVYSFSEVPAYKKRSVFTWGHSINDYRAYIDNMARVRLNELILWNDYVPVNIDEIIDYAHSYGITVVLGYSWGWNEMRGAGTALDQEYLNRVKERAVKEYRETYAPLGCDGIYFQSFTERTDDSINGKEIAAAVTDMVNEIAEEMWKITPDLRLLFGLHATSVKNRLSEIARVNPKIDIMWEDCGTFPYNYYTTVKSEEEFEETLAFTKEMLHLRGGVGVGLVFKGVMMLDWNKFVHQTGPYVMGNNHPDVSDHDRHVRAGGWRIYAADWMKNGAYARRMMAFIEENKLGEVHMCTAGTFDGGIYLPFALCAELFYRADQDYTDTLHHVARRSYIRVD
ncbi:MAG: hypothetical protein J6R89_07655 [Clostridia bacterium]|nr:hypothetical protein [Clostridia bacterium]